MNKLYILLATALIVSTNFEIGALKQIIRTNNAAVKQNSQPQEKIDLPTSKKTAPEKRTIARQKDNDITKLLTDDVVKNIAISTTGLSAEHFSDPKVIAEFRQEILNSPEFREQLNNPNFLNALANRNKKSLTERAIYLALAAYAGYNIYSNYNKFFESKFSNASYSDKFTCVSSIFGFLTSGYGFVTSAMKALA